MKPAIRRPFRHVLSLSILPVAIIVVAAIWFGYRATGDQGTAHSDNMQRVASARNEQPISTEIASNDANPSAQTDSSAPFVTSAADFNEPWVSGSQAPEEEQSESDLSTAVPESAPTPTEMESAANACTEDCVLIGVTLEDFPGKFDAISSFGELSGRLPNMVMFFQAWGDDDSTFKPWLPDLAEVGVDPLITWEPWRRSEGNDQSEFTLESIIAGQHDAYIRDWAQKAADHDGTIYLRFAHEMNTPAGVIFWYPWQGDPEAYVGAWRHVHDLFEEAGADNVEWVWSVAWMNADADKYYPGDAYVDWVGLTVLNFGSTVEGPGWRSFSTLYTEEDGGIPQSERAASFGKPVMITEVASAEQGGNKGQWIAEFGTALELQFPEVRAVVWNNYAQARHVPEADWRINSSSEALAGWQMLMSNSYITSPASRMWQTWARTDRPVDWGQVARTWMWGPEPFTDVREEGYVEAPGGVRNVRYYDKSRMEITHPDGDWTSPWYVTNGLLATELITGRVQRGDNEFEQWNPAEVNVAGDPDDPDGPTYASFYPVLNATPLQVGATVIQRIDRSGVVADDHALAGQGVTIAFYDEVTNHSIAAPFWAFMNASGPVWEFGQFVDESLFENPFFATGRPITEAYWADVTVGGELKLVLIQCFERRCLTYTPSNAPEWQVEAGNVGRHYYTWRFGA